MRRWVNTIAALLLLTVVFMMLGLRVAHPKSGLNSAVGSAKTSIVIYKKASNFQVGERLLVNTGSKDADPVVSIAKTVSKDSVDVQTERMIVQVNNQNVKGRIVALLPFIGGLFSVFGL